MKFCFAFISNVLTNSNLLPKQKLIATTWTFLQKSLLKNGVGDFRKICVLQRKHEVKIHPWINKSCVLTRKFKIFCSKSMKYEKILNFRVNTQLWLIRGRIFYKNHLHHPWCFFYDNPQVLLILIFIQKYCNFCLRKSI